MKKIAYYKTDKPIKTYHVTNNKYKYPVIDIHGEHDMDTYGYGGDAYGKGFYTSNDKDVIKGYLNNSGRDSYIRKQKIPKGAIILNYNKVPQTFFSKLNLKYTDSFTNLPFVDLEAYRNYLLDEDASPNHNIQEYADELFGEELNKKLLELGIDVIEYNPYARVRTDKQAKGKNYLIINKEMITDPRKNKDYDTNDLFYEGVDRPEFLERNLNNPDNFIKFIIWKSHEEKTKAFQYRNEEKYYSLIDDEKYVNLRNEITKTILNDPTLGWLLPIWNVEHILDILFQTEKFNNIVLIFKNSRKEIRERYFHYINNNENQDYFNYLSVHHEYSLLPLSYKDKIQEYYMNNLKEYFRLLENNAIDKSLRLNIEQIKVAINLGNNNGYLPTEAFKYFKPETIKKLLDGGIIKNKTVPIEMLKNINSVDDLYKYMSIIMPQTSGNIKESILIEGYQKGVLKLEQLPLYLAYDFSKSI